MNKSPILRKHFWLTIVLINCFVISLKAQNGRKVYKLPSLKDAPHIIPFNERFQFDQFIKDTVRLYTGTVWVGRFNYCYLYNEVEFIGPDGDTLSFEKPELVRYVAIGRHIYMRDSKEGFVEIVAGQNGLKLGKKEYLKPVSYEHKASYYEFNETGGPSGNRYFRKVLNPGILDGNNLKNITVVKDISYHFIDSNRRFYLADKNNLFKIYSKFRSQILEYLNTNNIDFAKEDDLKEVVSFCNALK
jgi:hypothetical protein